MGLGERASIVAVQVVEPGVLDGEVRVGNVHDAVSRCAPVSAVVDGHVGDLAFNTVLVHGMGRVRRLDRGLALASATELGRRAQCGLCVAAMRSHLQQSDTTLVLATRH